MPYSPLAIANYFLRKGHRAGRDIDPMKIQKLVYFAHGWSLAIYGKPLIDERVDAWAYGPVIPSLYHEFKRFGREPIRSPAFQVGPDGSPVPYSIPDNDQETHDLLNRIWEVYGGFSGIQLSNMTHEEGTPWDQVSKESGGRIVRGTDIPEQVIKQYFERVGSGVEVS